MKITLEYAVYNEQYPHPEEDEGFYFKYESEHVPRVGEEIEINLETMSDCVDDESVENLNTTKDQYAAFKKYFKTSEARSFEVESVVYFYTYQGVRAKVILKNCYLDYDNRSNEENINEEMGSSPAWIENPYSAPMPQEPFVGISGWTCQKCGRCNSPYSNTCPCIPLPMPVIT